MAFHCKLCAYILCACVQYMRLRPALLSIFAVVNICMVQTYSTNTVSTFCNFESLRDSNEEANIPTNNEISKRTKEKQVGLL